MPAFVLSPARNRPYIEAKGALAGGGNDEEFETVCSMLS
jgi:hypothetical protein